MHRRGAETLRKRRESTIRGHDLFEQVRFFSCDLLEEGLCLEPARKIIADLFSRGEGVFVSDRNRFARGFGQELRLTASLHGYEPPCGFVDGLAHGEQSVIA